MAIGLHDDSIKFIQIYIFTLCLMWENIMARIQAYVSKEVVEKINEIVEVRRQEGAAETDVSASSVISMLVELGLRVYEAQIGKKEEVFNQDEFNRVIMENVLKTQLAISKILGVSTLAPYVADNPKLNDYNKIVSEIKEVVSEEVSRFFIPPVDKE